MWKQISEEYWAFISNLIANLYHNSSFLWSFMGQIDLKLFYTDLTYMTCAIT